jgi:predicted GTPase
MTKAVGNVATTATGRAAAVVDLGLRACEAYGRTDLAARLTGAKRSLADPAVHAVVVGEFKQGKSSLVNGLVGATVCPVDDDVATAVPTHVRYGNEPSAELVFDGDPPRREPLALDQIRRWVVENDGGEAATSPLTGVGDESGARPAAVEVRLPRKLLASGLVLVDTPGVGGLGSAHAAASLTAASMADALLFVTDASQELTHSEVEFLRRAREMCSTVVCVLTKIDFYPAWRKVRDLNESHLRGELDVPVISVSTTLRQRATSSGDTELNEESGYPDLVRFLVRQVAGEATGRLAGEAAADVALVCAQIEAQLEAERAALADSERSRQVVSELTTVRQRVEALRSAAAKWNQTLGDGIADLTSDIDHDLRSRVRAVIQEADDAIEEADPADTWSEMESLLESRVADELLTTYTLLRDRATALSEQVGEHFREASGDVLDRIAVPNPTLQLAGTTIDHKIELERMKVGKQAMVALKSAYGGAIMFVMLGAMTGVTLGPLALTIGLVMGRKGLRDEKKRQRAVRQSQAKNAVRRYCDEVSFVVGKEVRDTLRKIHRRLRDYYTGLAQELGRSNDEALQRASEAVQRTQAERESRLRDIDGELGRLRQLREQAQAVAT